MKDTNKPKAKDEEIDHEKTQQKRLAEVTNERNGNRLAEYETEDKPFPR